MGTHNSFGVWQNHPRSPYRFPVCPFWIRSPTICILGCPPATPQRSDTILPQRRSENLIASLFLWQAETNFKVCIFQSVPRQKNPKEFSVHKPPACMSPAEAPVGKRSQKGSYLRTYCVLASCMREKKKTKKQFSRLHSRRASQVPFFFLETLSTKMCMRSCFNYRGRKNQRELSRLQGKSGDQQEGRGKNKQGGATDS